jgi:SAM-dependent methyltransferase
MAGVVRDGEGNVYRFDSEWTKRLEPELEWRRYWHQHDILDSLLPSKASILELGVGSGFTANYLRSRGHAVTTLDIDPEKKPDISANLAEYDFPLHYDCIIAFEILEHMPFSVVRRTLPRIAAHCGSFVFSVPRNVLVWLDLSIKLPRIRELAVYVTTSRRGRISGNHHWELGKHSISRDVLEKVITDSGLGVMRRERFKHWVFYVTEPANSAAANDSPGTS